MTDVPFRELFATSRAGEYFDPKTLQSMVGQPRHRFGDVILKELIDNALDAAESANHAPEVTITVAAKHAKTDDGDDPVSYKVLVEDNGPGVPDEAIDKLLDYSVLVSDKAAYRSPTRGQQGNALKTVVGIPYALGVTDPVVITTPQGTHIITPRVDPVGEIIIDHQRRSLRRAAGTAIEVTLPEAPDAARWARDFALTNPHALITATIQHANDGDGPTTVSYKPTVDDRWSKPLPTTPTSPWWYDPDSFLKLVFAHVSKCRNGGRDKPLGTFLREFAGLTSTAKAKGIARLFTDVDYLSDFERCEHRVPELHQQMIAGTREPKPATLGQVPEEHYRQLFTDLYGVERERFWFKRVPTKDGTVPYVVEIAVAETADRPGTLTFAVNYSPTFDDPTARLPITAGDSKQTLFGTGVTSMLRQMDAMPDGHNMRAAAIHLITPAAQFTDKGKTGLAVGDGTR